MAACGALRVWPDLNGGRVGCSVGADAAGWGRAFSPALSVLRAFAYGRNTAVIDKQPGGGCLL